MSEVKKFKSALDSPVTLEVEGNINSQGVFLAVDNSTILLAPSDAPALALAVLEAAGYGEEVVTDGSPDGHIQVAKYYLHEGVKAQERATAEVRERAELEAEALELFNVNQGINLPDWGNADRAVISSWIRVARRARELAKEATK